MSSEKPVEERVFDRVPMAPELVSASVKENEVALVKLLIGVKTPAKRVAGGLLVLLF